MYRSTSIDSRKSSRLKQAAASFVDLSGNMCGISPETYVCYLAKCLVTSLCGTSAPSSRGRHVVCSPSTIYNDVKSKLHGEHFFRMCILFLLSSHSLVSVVSPLLPWQRLERRGKEKEKERKEKKTKGEERKVSKRRGKAKEWRGKERSVGTHLKREMIETIVSDRFKHNFCNLTRLCIHLIHLIREAVTQRSK